MLVQVLLIVSILVVAGVLLRGQGSRHQAIRRLLLAAFFAFAIISVLFPDMWNAFAHVFGVGRGTDLLLYGLIVAFMGFMVTSYFRFRELELKMTRMARRLALAEAPRPADTGDAPGALPAHDRPQQEQREQGAAR